MSKKRHFNEAWLDKTDSNGHPIYLWCIKKTDFVATCKLCNKDINTQYMGFSALMQHSKQQKHVGFSSHLKEKSSETKGACKLPEKSKKDDTQREVATGHPSETKGQQSVLHQFFVKKSCAPQEPCGRSSEQVASLPKQSASKESTSTGVWSIKQLAAKAEIMATLQFVAQNVPFNSAENLASCYREQFPDSVVAQNVTIGPKKMSYLVAYGLGPYFSQNTVRELMEGPSFFTLHFDETTTAQVRKQMDLLVRFWSETHGEVRVKYLTSVMFGHAKAVNVVTEMFCVLEEMNVPLRLMVSLGMDGPNVNKSIMNKINEAKRGKGFEQLVICPESCLLHVCHNSFQKGTAKYGSNAEELCLNLYYFFKRSSCRRVDLFEIEDSLGLEELVVLRHVQSRWLSLLPALQRLTKIKDAIKKLLLEELPKNDKSIVKNDKYLMIKKALQSKEVDIEIEFLMSIKPLFDEFMTKFQLEQPMIHLLYPSIEKLLKVAMGRLMKTSTFTDKKGRELKEVDIEDVNSQLKDTQFKVMQGHNVATLVDALPEASRKKVLLGMRAFYKAVLKHLQTKLPLEDVLLKALKCLNPREQRKSSSLQHCKVIAARMPSVQPQEEVKAGDEWIRYQEIDLTEDDLELRVDHFWHKIFNNRDVCGDKFEVLPKMVKCALALCHSNADVERSLSTNKRMLTKQNVSLSDETIRGLRATKAAIQEFGDPSKVPITLDVLKVAEKSHQLYTEHLRQESAKAREKKAEQLKREAHKRKLEEASVQEKQLKEELKKLKAQEKDVQDASERAMGYIKEGQQKITDALKVDDMLEIEAGNKLVEFGTDKQAEAKEKLQDIRKKIDETQEKFFKISKSKMHKT